MTKINNSIVIAALARDCGDKLKQLIPLIEQLRANFVWSQVIIVENDSKDNTKEILKNWQKNSFNIQVFSQDFGTVTIPEESSKILKPLISFHRIEKMAIYRNIYMKYIEEVKHDIDNVVIIDVDVQSFSIDGVVKAILKCKDNCGGIFANGVTVKKMFGKTYSKIFYDVFAVYEYPLKNKFGFTDASLYKTLKSVNSKLKKNTMYPVVSAFGGLAVYNYSAISNLKYEVIENDLNINEAVCEHIPFNREIINLGYENFISNEMELIYGEHSFGTILKYYLDKRLFIFLFKTANFFKS